VSSVDDDDDDDGDGDGNKTLVLGMLWVLLQLLPVLARR